MDERNFEEATVWQKAGYGRSPDKKPCSAWWVAFLSVGYFAGLRWLSETLALRWEDVRFASRAEIRVWNQKARRHHRVTMCNTLTRRLKEWMHLSDDVSDRALVFPHKCHTRTLDTEWKRIQKAAGVEDCYRLHDLRVSFCTNLVEAGVAAAQLMKLARHRSITTTLKFYRGRTVTADQEAVDTMDALLTQRLEQAELAVGKG